MPWLYHVKCDIEPLKLKRKVHTKPKRWRLKRKADAMLMLWRLRIAMNRINEILEAEGLLEDGERVWLHWHGTKS